MLAWTINIGQGALFPTKGGGEGNGNGEIIFAYSVPSEKLFILNYKQITKGTHRRKEIIFIQMSRAEFFYVIVVK